MSSQCEECGTQNIDDLNEEYNWCNSCLKNFNFLNFEVSINRFSDGKNEKIDDVIQEMQSKIKGPGDIIFEWIPYNQFNNISEEGKGDSAKACSAIWKDGPLTYSYFKKKLVRVSNKKVVLKYLFNSKDIKFLDEVKIYSINYSKNIYIYGISQDPSTKDYIIVLNAKALKKQIDDFNAEKRQKLEEMIKEKTKDFEFNYFEYSKFSNLKGIGKEGFDMVKKAKTDNGIKVVLKAFIDENSKIENFISNFMKELELLHMVGYHDNINRFLGITKDDIGNYFMIQMAFDITCGLKYLHSKGIIHRHLHSNNILANNDRLLISDFGLSNLMGVLLWEITSGRPPFHDDNVLQDDMKRSNLQNYTGHMSFREEQIEGTPLEFRRLYEKCLNVDPEKRPDINQVYKEILNQSDDLYEEEWIKKKMKEEDICYFEYSKFSNFEEIGKGGFGVVKKAMTDDGNKVALKGLIENSKIRRNVIKTFVKELKNLRLVSHHDNINKFLGISKDHAGNYIMRLAFKKYISE
ncbi:unnamed protein product [Rhizophagus irregularis]|nr:unnamed protein product [Rhizophagus irregularis]